MTFRLTKYSSNYLSLVVGLTFLFLSLPLNGYNLPVLALLLVPLIKITNLHIKLEKKDAFLIGLLSLLFVDFLLNAIFNYEPLRALDKSIRILLYLLIFLVFIEIKINIVIVNAGIIFGAYSSGVCAVFQQYTTGAARVGWHINPIQFGMFSMLLALLSFILFNFYLNEFKKKNTKFLVFVSSITLLASLLGLYASISSGSRGAWLAFPLFIFVYFKQNEFFNKNNKALIVSKKNLFYFSTAVLLILYKLPQLNVASRVLEAKNNIEKYFEQNLIESTAGARLEMWRVALQLGFEKPLFGWGHTGYHEGVKQMVESKQTSAFLLNFNEPHNQFLDIFAKYGLCGVVLISMLYFWTTKIFMFQFGQSKNSIQSVYPLMGAVSMMAFTSFSLTHSFINKNGGMMLFLFCLTLFWALSKQEYEQASPK